MAEKYNMKLLFKAPFADYFQQKIHNSENRGLIGRMQGLEVNFYELLITAKQNSNRMWANAQRDGRPAKHRWRPLFNAAKFG